jgi:hypothetical protein
LKNLQREVEANFEKFSSSWKAEMLKAYDELEKSNDNYKESYKRLTTLQAWRGFLDSQISLDSLAFFLEAQNDALVSHVFARLGSWRSALKSLRSCLENAMYCLYYMDHPVELELWHRGKHRLAFASLYDYFEHHPKLINVAASVTGIQILKAEFSTLSRAVHASAKRFRMTVDSAGTLLWSTQTANLGAWATREAAVVSGLNLLLLTLFRDKLQGSSVQNLRKAVSLAISTSKHPSIKTELKITLFKP